MSVFDEMRNDIEALYGGGACGYNVYSDMIDFIDEAETDYESLKKENDNLRKERDHWHVEHGTFSFYEVKSCVEDLKSGHGLNFYGDENWLVMPVEMYESYKVLSTKDDYVRKSTRLARCLLYGIGRNGRPTFWEQQKNWVAEWHCRKYGAAELLFAMMRAMIANSDHSNVNHQVRRIKEESE